MTARQVLRGFIANIEVPARHRDRFLLQRRPRACGGSDFVQNSHSESVHRGWLYGSLSYRLDRTGMRLPCWVVGSVLGSRNERPTAAHR